MAHKHHDLRDAAKLAGEAEVPSPAGTDLLVRRRLWPLSGFLVAVFLLALC